MRDADYLDWRYRDSPRAVRGFATGGGLRSSRYARLRDGISAALVLRARRAAIGARLRECGASARPTRDVAVALREPRRSSATYLAAGFVPTPRTIRFIGRRCAEDAPSLAGRRRVALLRSATSDFF